MEFRTFLNQKLKEQTDVEQAKLKAINMLRDYEQRSPTILLPDLMDSNSLPVGTVAQIEKKGRVNPSLIGMDIGCGYRVLSVPLNSRRFHKKGKLKINSTSELVHKISEEIERNKLKEDRVLGTIGKGNHFVDILVPEEIYQLPSTQKENFEQDCIYFVIHTGSRKRGFDTQREFVKLFSDQEIKDGEFNLLYAKAVLDTTNYAFRNRDSLQAAIVRALSEIEEREVSPILHLDSPHNFIVQDENSYTIRKGASSLRPGELGFIAGAATTPSYLVIGDIGLLDSNFSINHGCGRKYTRSRLRTRFDKRVIDNYFREVVLNVRPSQMIEELAEGYKDVEDVIKCVEEFKLAQKSIKLKPVGVIVER